MTAGSPAVNIANGSLTLELTQPGGSPNDPRTFLTYNSGAADQTIQYGYGWAGGFNRSVERIASTAAVVVTGTGQAWLYHSLDVGTGFYTQPAGAVNSLQQITSPAGWVETQPNGLQLFYDDISDSGKLVKLQRGSAVWTLTYDSDLVETMIDPDGRVTTYAYDGSDKLERITDSAGRTTTFTVDGSGDLTQLITPELCITDLVYDGSHRLIAYVDPQGNRTSFSYDVNDYVTQMQRPSGDLTTYSYVSDTAATVTDPLGGITTILFDSVRSVVGKVSPLGQKTTFSWSNGRLSGAQEPASGSTGLVYSSALADGTRQLSAITSADGSRVTFLYDTNGRVESTVDQLSRVSTLVWDGSNRTAIIDPFGQRTSFTYNAAGQVTEEIDPLGNVTTQVYDNYGQVIARVNPLGERTSYTFDTYGQQIEVIDPLGNVSTTVYDLMNRPTVQINPLGERTSLSYDLNGQLVSTENPLGQITTNLYDVNRRLEATINPLEQRMTYVYDALGRQTQVIGPPAVTGQDNFNRSPTPSTDLGPNWIQQVGEWEITSNKLHAVGEVGGSLVTWRRVPTSSDYTVSAVVRAANGGTRLLLRARSIANTSGYELGLYMSNSSPEFDLYLVENGSFTALAFSTAISAPINTDHTITLELRGSQLTGYLNGTAVLTATDETYSLPGHVALRMGVGGAGGVNATFDDFVLTENSVQQTVYDADGRMVSSVNPVGERNNNAYDAAGNLLQTLPPPANLFAYDDFNRGDSSSLGPFWTEAAGDWEILSRYLHPVNETTGDVLWTQSPPTADYTVEAQVFAGLESRTLILLARSQDVNNDYRVALIPSSSGSATLELRKLVGGSITTLKSLAVHAPLVTSHLLRLTVQGNVLTAVLNNSYSLQVQDDTFSAVGKAGCRMYSPTTGSGLDVGFRQFRVYSSQATQSVYDSQNRLIASVDALARRTTYSYDLAGNQVAVKNPLGQITTSVYDATNRPVATVDPLGLRSTTIYDAAGRPVASENPLGERNTTVYDAAGRSIASINPLGYRSTSVYDVAGRVIERINPLGQINTTVYDAAGRTVAGVNPLGQRSTSTYDAAGRPRERINPLGETTTSIYDAAGKPVASINPLGFRNTSVYDNSGRGIATVNPLGEITTSIHDAAGRTVATLDPLGYESDSYFDPTGRSSASSGPAVSLGTDDFNRASVGPNWTQQVGSWAIVGTDLLHATNESSTDLILWNRRPTSADYTVGATLRADINDGTQMLVLARVQEDYNNRYELLLRISASTPYLALHAIVNGTIYGLGLTTDLSVPLLTDHPVALEVRGSRLTAYFHGLPVLSVEDHTFTNPGRVGFRMGANGTPSGTNATYDDFWLSERSTQFSQFDVANQTVGSVDPLGVLSRTEYDGAGRTSQSLSVPITRWASDDFGGSLGNWTQTVGAWSISGGYAHSDGTSGSTLVWTAGLPTPDYTIEAVVKANAATSTCRLQGRWLNVNNYYVAEVKLATSGANLVLARVLGGAFETLAEMPLTVSLSQDYPLSLAMQGDQITVTFNNQISLQARDSALTAAGQASFRSGDATAYYSRFRVLTPQIQQSVYDAAGNSIASVDALGYRSTTVYDKASRPVEQVDPLGCITTSVYDPAGRSIASVNPLENRWTSVYDAANHVVNSITPINQVSTSIYDANGNTIASINPLGETSTTVYDKAGRPLAQIDANGNITTTVYDAAGRSVANISALGFLTTQVFDAANRRIAILDANAGLNTFVYDARGQETKRMDPLGRVTTSTYDEAGRQVTKLDARAIITTFSWDARNQALGRVYLNDAPVTIQYDPLGNRILTADSTGTSTMVYDPLNRLQAITDPAGKTITYSYDSREQRASMIDPDGGRTTYSYDAAGRMRTLLDAASELITFSYDADNRETLIELAGAGRTSQTYDAAGRMIQTFDFDSVGAVLQGFTYEFDAVGNKLTQTEGSGNITTWSYDDTYQLIKEQYTGTTLTYDKQWTYDPLGNRLVQNVDGALTTSTYDLANQHRTSVEADGVTTFTFDAAGNQRITQKPNGDLTTSTWDDENREVRIALPDGKLTTNTFRADGLRYEKQDSTGIVRLIYDGQNYLLETDENNDSQAQFTNKPQQYGALLKERRME